MSTYKRRRFGASSSSYRKRSFGMRRRAVGSRRAPARRTRRPSNRRTGGYVGIELKCLDQALSAQVKVPTTELEPNEFSQCLIGNISADPAAMGCLNAPGTGPAFYQRDGRQIYMKSIHVTGQLQLLALDQVTAASFHAPTCIIALVLDTQANAAANTLGDVFVNPLGAQNGIDANGAMRGVTNPLPNLEKRTRYRILKLKRIVFNTDTFPNSAATADSYLTALKTKMFQITHRFKGRGLPVTFTGTNAGGYGTIANISDNALHMVAYTGVAALDFPAYQIVYNSRLRYVG